MTKTQAFEILGIAPTDDADAITAAYRAELPKHHPEEDQAGFKLLREAYEEAQRIAREGDGDDGGIQTTDFADASEPVSVVMQRVIDIYQDYPKRIDPAVWEELLSDPVFSDFEYEVEARFRLLSFISEHFRMPLPIYKLLDKKLLIGEHATELSERLASNFVTFLVNSATSEEDGWEFRFDAVEGYPTPDKDDAIDSFIGELLSEIGKNPNDEAFASDEVMKRLDAYGMSHPYLTLLRMRAKVKREEAISEEELARVAEYRERYPNDQRILNDAFVIYAYEQANDRLRALCDGVIDKLEADEPVEQFAKYYANYHLGRLAEEDGKYEDALEFFINASGVSYSSAVKEHISSVGEHIIEEYEKKESLTDEESETLASVYRVTDAEAGIKYFEEHPERRAETAGVAYNIACMRLMLEDPEGLFAEVERGMRLLETEHLNSSGTPAPGDVPSASKQDATGTSASRSRAADSERTESVKLTTSRAAGSDDTTADTSRDDSAEKKEEDYIRHKGKFRCLEAQAYVSRAYKNKDDAEARRRDLTEALSILDEVEEESPDLAYFDDLRMHIYKERADEGDADRIIEIAEKLLSEDGSSYNAASHLQAAYEMKREAQGVIDAFYRARAIYAGDAEIYERVAKVFSDFGQYDDVERILGLAEDSGVSSPMLSIEGFFAAGMQAKNLAEWRAAYDKAAQVINELRGTEDIDGETIARAHFKRSKLCREPEVLKTDPPSEKLEELEAEDLKKAVEADPTLIGARYQLGIYYYNLVRDNPDTPQEQRDEWSGLAYEHLKYSADNGYCGIWLYWVLANYEEDRDNRVAAINYMKYVVENDEDAVDQLSRIGSWAQMEYYDTHIEEYAKMAIEYCNLCDEKTGERPATFFDRGYVYSVHGDYEKSTEQFLGLIRVVAGLDEDETNRRYHTRLRGTAYEMIAENYLYLHDYDRAIEYALTALKEFDIPDFYSRKKSVYKTIYRAYLWNGEYKRGIIYFDGELADFQKPNHWEDSERQQELNGDNIREFRHFLRNLALCDGQKSRALELQRLSGGGDILIDGKKADFTWRWLKPKASDLFWMAQSFSDVLGYDMREALHQGERVWKREYRRDRLHFEEDADYGQVNEVRNYINFLILMGQQLTIFGYDDKWADDIFRKAEYAADLLGDRFKDRDDLYNWWMWNAYFRGDAEAAARYAERYIVEWGYSHKYTNDKGLNLREAVHDDFNHRKSGLFVLCQTAAATGDIEGLRGYLGQMENCRPCPHCMYAECFEELAMRAWLLYLDGDAAGAAEMAERSLSETWDHNCDYAEMLIYRRLGGRADLAYYAYGCAEEKRA